MATAYQQVIAPCALVACAYYIAGFLGLTAAIPPGYATIIWPSAGIALGSVYVAGLRVLPGVWLGSFLLNLWVPDHPSAWLAMVPATGAVVHAAWGAWLMRRMLRVPWLWNPTRILVFFGIAGLSSIINAWWSPLILGLEPLGLQVRTWWIGDAIGSCLFAPLLVFLASEMEEHDGAPPEVDR